LDERARREEQQKRRQENEYKNSVYQQVTSIFSPHLIFLSYLVV
jgi:hypothetical protein